MWMHCFTAKQCIRGSNFTILFGMLHMTTFFYPLLPPFPAGNQPAVFSIYEVFFFLYLIPYQLCYVYKDFLKWFLKKVTRDMQ